MISKSQIFRIHKWCGLFASLLILAQAATGLVQAYRTEIGQVIDPTGMARQSVNSNVPLNDVFETLKSAYADRQVDRIVFPECSSCTYFVHVTDAAAEKTYASIDPGSAVLLRSGSIWTFPAEAAARIHYDYTVGLPGMAIIAITGIIGLALAITGVVFWWPRPGRRWQQLGIKWNLPNKFVLRQLHRSGGVVMALFLGFSFATGLVLAIYYLNAAAGAATTSGAALVNNNMDVDYVIRQARTQYPEHEVRDIRFVGMHRINVFFNAPERSPRAAHMVSIDPDDGSILKVLDAKADTELWVTWLPLHSGETFGAVGLFLVTTNALILIGLALSGPLMWFNRVSSRRRRSS